MEMITLCEVVEELDDSSKMIITGSAAEKGLQKFISLNSLSITKQGYHC